MDRVKKLCFAYVTNRVTLDQFLDAFAELYAIAATEFSGADLDAMGNLGLSVGEFTNGDMSEAEFKGDVLRYGLAQFTVVSDRPAKPAVSQASIVERQVEFV